MIFIMPNKLTQTICVLKVTFNHLEFVIGNVNHHHRVEIKWSLSPETFIFCTV